MLEKKEVIHAGIVIVLMALVLSFIQNEFQIGKFLIYLIFALIIISSSIFAKKITAKILDLKVDISILQWQRWWIATRDYFKRPVPVGLIFPPLMSFLFGYRYFLCFLQYDAKALPSRVAKKYGSKRFSGIMEWDDALIVFYSTIPILLLAAISSFFGNVDILRELSIISFSYALWNLLPIGRLDGGRLFFGSKPLFVFTWILIAMTALIVFL